MRVLVMAHWWIPEHNAGAEVMLHGMLRALVARGHQVTVMLSMQVGEPYDLDGIWVHPGHGPNGSVLTEIIPKADVIVTHLQNTPAATLRAKWAGIPVVQVLHNTMQVTRDWLVREPVALAVCNSQWMHLDYAMWCASVGKPMPRTVVVRPPVVAADYATTPGDRVTLVNLRPDEQASDGTVYGKGAELFWRLAELMPSTRFLGVKGGYGTQLVRDLPNVEVIDHVPHHRMRDDVYARTRVLLMPSSYESWGRTAVEAMASGIPVIAHETPGLAEALGPNRLFCDRGDPREWVSLLNVLATPGGYRRASALALERSAQLDPTADLAAWCDAVESLPTS